MQKRQGFQRKQTWAFAPRGSGCPSKTFRPGARPPPSSSESVFLGLGRKESLSSPLLEKARDALDDTFGLVLLANSLDPAITGAGAQAAGCLRCSDSFFL